MLENFDLTKKQLDELSSILNKFKSEAVQLRILDHLFDATAFEEVVGVKKVDVKKKEAAVKPRKPKKPKTPSTPNDAPSPNSKSKKEGPTGVLNQLIQENYFADKRTIGDIREYCKVNLARNFKATDLSPALTRLTKDRVLAREKNSESRSYEYFVR